MRKYLYGISTFVLAFAILSVSLFRSTSISYVLATALPENTGPEPGTPQIDYQIPYPGKVLPDSPFWSLKAARDITWYFLTTNPLKKAELALLFSDKRLAAARTLFENKKPDLGLTTLSKGEKYLERAAREEAKAREAGMDTNEFLTKLAKASLKHRQIIEDTLPLIPEDGKPVAIRIENYSKNAYNSSRDALNSKGIPAPINPFDRQ